MDDGVYSVRHMFLFWLILMPGVAELVTTFAMATNPLARPRVAAIIEGWDSDKHLLTGAHEPCYGIWTCSEKMCLISQKENVSYTVVTPYKATRNKPGDPSHRLESEAPVPAASSISRKNQVISNDINVTLAQNATDEGLLCVDSFESAWAFRSQFPSFYGAMVCYIMSVCAFTVLLVLSIPPFRAQTNLKKVAIGTRKLQDALLALAILLKLIFITGGSEHPPFGLWLHYMTALLLITGIIFDSWLMWLYHATRSRRLSALGFESGALDHI